jgi:NADH:ubiquinone oxidoreductase subunit 5 (subunit L)/multisubunit Na+/H+ antiporter MnhA subunit
MLSPRGKGILAVLSGIPAVAAVILLFSPVHGGGAIEVRSVGWDGLASLVFHVDALSVLFAFMGTTIGLIVLIYSVGYMAEEKAATRFYALMLPFIAGLVGLVLSANLLLMYVCWEIVGLCSFGSIGYWYQNPEAVRGARKVPLMTHLAGSGLLAAILILYMRTGSSLWTDPYVGQAFTDGLFLLMLLALVAKSVQFPLNTWIPEAMAAPTPVSTLLPAACYVKAGVHLAARMHSFAAWPASWVIGGAAKNG